MLGIRESTLGKVPRTSQITIIWLNSVVWWSKLNSALWLA